MNTLAMKISKNREYGSFGKFNTNKSKDYGISFLHHGDAYIRIYGKHAYMCVISPNSGLHMHYPFTLGLDGIE